MPKKQRDSQNILVTGGAGFIGSAFIHYVLAKAEFTGNIVNVDLLTYAADLANLEDIATHPRYTFYHANICNTACIEKICKKHKIDTIVHFAAETHVDRSIDGPYPFIETNVIGTFSLLEIVRKFPLIHFHHISTDEVYGALGKEGSFCESSPYCPNSPYAAAKAASDHFVRAYAHTYNLSTTISHCSNNYGPRQHKEKFIPTVILRCLQNEKIPIYGRGDNIRDWLYVDDHAAAIWQILVYGLKGQTYDIGANQEYANKELADKIIKILAEYTKSSYEEKISLLTYVPDRAGHDFRYSINYSKLQKFIGWQPRYCLQEGLEATIPWYIKKISYSCCL